MLDTWCICQIRHLRKDLGAPARCQCEQAWSQVTSRIYRCATVSWHWHWDPQYDHCHYNRNQLWGSRSVPRFIQTQDAHHQHGRAHHLMDIQTQLLQNTYSKRRIIGIYPPTWSRKLLPKLRYSVGYVANIEAVSFGPYTVSTPPLKSIIASESRDNYGSNVKQIHSVCADASLLTRHEAKKIVYSDMTNRSKPDRQAPRLHRPQEPERCCRAPVCSTAPDPEHRSSEWPLGSDGLLQFERWRTHDGSHRRQNVACVFVCFTWDVFGQVHGGHDTHREGHVGGQKLAFRLTAGFHLRCSRAAEELQPG